MKNGDYILVIAPDDYPGKRYRGRYCYEHHLLYWQAYGVTPTEEEIVHHKDGNKHNNSIENLELISRKDHSYMHTKSRGKKMLSLKCPVCGKVFAKEKRKTHVENGRGATYCSKRCSNEANSMRLHDYENLAKGISENIIGEFHSLSRVQW